jgi:hypothetical protein
MYRIELSPGEEAAFRSIEELAVAIKRGVVTSRARIWHNASSKWLPIEFHPHYKIAASMQLTTADLVAGAPVKPLELLTLGELMDPPAPPVRPAVQPELPRAQRTLESVKRTLESVKRIPESVKRIPDPVKRIPEPEPRPRKKAAAKARRTRSGRHSMRVALTGALLIGCAHLTISAVSAALSQSIAVGPPTHRRLVTPTNTAQQGWPETTAAAVLPGLPAIPRSGVRTSSAARRTSAAPLPTESAAATPPYGAFQADSASAIQPAPASVDIAAPTPPSGDSLARRMVDSTGKKTLKRVLRTISGTAPTEQARPKR